MKRPRIYQSRIKRLASLMEVAVPMLAEQLSQSAVEQRINNGYTGGCVEERRRRRSWLLFVRLTALSDFLERFYIYWILNLSRDIFISLLYLLYWLLDIFYLNCINSITNCYWFTINITKNLKKQIFFKISNKRIFLSGHPSKC